MFSSRNMGISTTVVNLNEENLFQKAKFQVYSFLQVATKGPAYFLHSGRKLQADLPTQQLTLSPFTGAQSLASTPNPGHHLGCCHKGSWGQVDEESPT